MSVLINRIKIRNFKSIASCDVSLTSLSVLVGLNGAGKSNFLDAFQFLSDACNTTLDTAIRNRGGLTAVRRKSSGHPNNFGISVFMNLADGRSAHFAFEVAALPNERFEVRKESATISDSDPLKFFEYQVEKGKLVRFSESNFNPDIRSDRLFITSVAGIKPFDQLYDSLSAMSVYDINPDEFRFPQPHESGDILKPSGQNLPSVLRRLNEASPDTYKRITEYLRGVVRGIELVEPRSLGPTETIQFSQLVQGAASPWRFDALNMSSGTLRSLGVLLALFHRLPNQTDIFPFIGIEEPEGTIHPGAAAVLMDAILEASKTRQIVLSTHSPELIDHPGIKDNNILVVTSTMNETRIGLADNASRQAIRDNLLTAGELLRANQLENTKEQPRALSQADLFKSLDAI